MTQKSPPRAPRKRGRGRPKGGGLTPEQSRENILDAAEQCFARAGIDKTTVDDIATEAGCARSIVYRHFDCRDDLLLHAWLRVAQQLHRDVLERVAGREDLGDQLVEAVACILAYSRENPMTAAILSHEGGAARAGAIALDRSVVLTQAGTYVIEILDVLPASRKRELRPNLGPDELAEFVLRFVMSLLTAPGVVVGDDAIRRYTRAFLLPAVLAHPPPLPDSPIL